MSIFGALLGGPLERRTVDASALTWTSIMGLPPAKSGVSVNINTALRVSTVLGCTRVLAEGVAQLPLKLLKEGPLGQKTQAREHPLYRVLSRRPNSWMTSFEFRETLGYHAVLSRGGFAFIARVGGRVDELIPLVPECVAVRVPLAVAGEVLYDVTLRNGQHLVLPKSDVLHVRGPSWDGYLGMEAIQLAREAIGLAISTEETQAKLNANGGRPGGVLSTDQALRKEARDVLREEWTARFGPNGNPHGVAVLDAGLKFQSLSMTGVDAQHIETRRHQVEEICRAFRVFPQMIGYSDKTSTYASAEQFFIAHVVHSLGPWIERWEQALTRDLLTESEIASGLFPKLFVQGLLRGDAKSRAEFYRASLGSASAPGWNSPNDIRRLEDQDPIDDPGMDKVVTANDMTGKPAVDGGKQAVSAG